MKTLNALKLHNLNQAEMAKKEQNLLKGGQYSCSCTCGAECGCKYAGGQTDPNDSYHGGSSTNDNGKANGDSTRDTASSHARSNSGNYY